MMKHWQFFFLTKTCESVSLMSSAPPELEWTCVFPLDRSSPCAGTICSQAGSGWRGSYRHRAYWGRSSLAPRFPSPPPLQSALCVRNSTDLKKRPYPLYTQRHTFFSQVGKKFQKTNTVALLEECNRQSMSRRKTAIESQDIEKNKIYIVALNEKCLLKWKSKIKKKNSVILSEIYFLHMTSCLCQVIGIHIVFSCVNCKLNTLWIYVIFLFLEGPSCSFSFGMPVWTCQFKGWARPYSTD